MKPPKLNIFGTLRIAIYYLAYLAFAIGICFFALGTETILVYASGSRPYSVLFSKHSYQGLLKDSTSIRIIFFGDSNSFTPPDKPGPRPENQDIHISGLVHEEMSSRLAGEEVLCVGWAFASANMFDYYCLLYEALKFSPDLIVVPVNWRYFGSQWMENPRYFHPELSAFVPLYNKQPPGVENPVRSRGISAIKQIEYKVDILSLYFYGFKNWFADFRESAVAGGRQADAWPKPDFDWLNESRTSAFSAKPTDAEKAEVDSRKLNERQSREDTTEASPPPHEQDQDAFFPMMVSDSNPVLREIHALAGAASDHNTKVLFYIWPLDKELLALSGRWNEPALDASKKRIAEAINMWANDEILLVDLSDLLEHQYFFDPAGHCTVKGRKKIAEALAPQIMEILGAASASDQ